MSSRGLEAVQRVRSHSSDASTNGSCSSRFLEGDSPEALVSAGHDEKVRHGWTNLKRRSRGWWENFRHENARLHLRHTPLRPWVNGYKVEIGNAMFSQSQEPRREYETCYPSSWCYLVSHQGAHARHVLTSPVSNAEREPARPVGLSQDSRSSRASTVLEGQRSRRTSAGKITMDLYSGSMLSSSRTANFGKGKKISQPVRDQASQISAHSQRDKPSISNPDDSDTRRTTLQQSSKKIKSGSRQSSENNNNAIPHSVLERKTRTEKRNYRCTFAGCTKAFTKRGNLVAHERIHTKEQPFRCQHCGRHFNHLSNLNMHIQRHTGNWRYRCPLCKKGFARNDRLTRHISKTHPDHPRPQQLHSKAKRQKVSK